MVHNVYGAVESLATAKNLALKGVNRAYFVYPIRPGLVQATAQFAQSAREARVEAIVNMWPASARGDAKSHSARDHWLAERVFDWSGLNVTHIRPTYFAEMAALPSTTLADLVYAAILCRDFFGSAGIAEAVA